MITFALTLSLSFLSAPDFANAKADYAGVPGQAGAQSGSAKCNKENPDLSSFPPQWSHAMISRLSGEPVTINLGQFSKTVEGDQKSADKILKLSASWAKEFDKCGTEVSGTAGDINAVYFTTALMAAIACQESEWIANTKYDEEKSGGIAGCKGDKECNESRGLLQLTYKSDKNAPGCAIGSQSDLDSPEANLLCGLGKLDQMNLSNVHHMVQYWSTLGKRWEKVAQAVSAECASGFANIRNQHYSGAQYAQGNTVAPILRAGRR